MSKQTVTDWKVQGLVVFNDDGKVDFDATDIALKDHGIRQVVDDDTGFDLRADASKLMSTDGAKFWSKADAEKVKENYAARLKQLEYDKQSALVVEVDEVIAAVGGEYSVVRQRVGTLGSSLASRLASVSSASVAKAIIDAEVVEALRDLSIAE